MPCQKCSSFPLASLYCLSFIDTVYRFLYWMLLCVDACFRMKNRLKSSESKDPTLGAGLAYFTDHGPYIDFVKQYVNQEEVRPNRFVFVTYSLTHHLDKHVFGVCSNAPVQSEGD
jgi:hypothetical protein